MKIAYIGIDPLDAALKTLLQCENCEIVRIFTCRTDNKTEFNTETIALSEAHHIPWTDRRIREADMEALRDAGCEAVLCAGYYHKIPVSGILPIVNVHPSLLPLGRGAWPMPVTILRQLPESGVTLHRMSAAMDEGEILLQARCPVAEDETLQTLTAKLSRLTETLVRELMTDFHGHYARALPQGEGEYWPCPTEEDWTLTPSMADEQIDRVLRAFDGYECIWAEDGLRYELIGGRLYRDERGIPASQRRFRTCGGSFVSAPRVHLVAEEIDFCHEAAITRLLKMTHNDSSAYAFPSLYLWQKTLGLRIAFFHDCFIVKCSRRGENAWFFPVGEAEDCRRFLSEHIDEADFSLCYVSEPQLALLRQWFPGYFHAEETPDDAEYICDIAGHMRLEGRAYANVRKQLRKAEKMGPLTLRPIGAEDTADAERLLNEWQSRKKGLELPDDIAASVLRYAGALHMELYLAVLDGEVCGVVGGFPLSEDCFDGCLVMLRENLPGLSYAVKHLFFEKLRDRYSYVNIEEDLGIPGLRLMKQLLVPARMNDMWEVCFNREA